MLQPHASMANYCTSGSESTNRESGSESISEHEGVTIGLRPYLAIAND